MKLQSLAVLRHGLECSTGQHRGACIAGGGVCRSKGGRVSPSAGPAGGWRLDAPAEHHRNFRGESA